MAKKCKFYDICPNGGLFTRCTSTGYVAECVPHIFDALEEDFERRKALVKTNPFVAFAEIGRKLKIQAEEPREPLKVKVRRHKR